jgi:hypothetical protein
MGEPKEPKSVIRRQSAGHDDVSRENARGQEAAFKIIASLPNDFLQEGRNDTPPQEREDQPDDALREPGQIGEGGMGTLSVKPYIGPHFASTRLLLLGESAYSWKNNKGEIEHPSADHPTEQVNGIIAKFDDPVQPFMQTLSRALANDFTPSPERLMYVWSRVAFANFVPGTVGIFGETDTLRPSPQDWERGKSEFYALLEEVKPLRMMVLGLEAWENLPGAYLGEERGAMAFRLSTGELCWCLPLRHPSAKNCPTTWKQLAAAIYFAFPDQFREPG